jgi:hypothetical protein
MASKKNGFGNGKGEKGEKKGPVSLEDKARRAAGEEVVDAILAASDEELQERLTTLAKHEADTEHDLETNEGVVEAREAKKAAADSLKEAEGGFKDTLKSIKLQRNLIAQTLEQRGK